MHTKIFPQYAEGYVWRVIISKEIKPVSGFSKFVRYNVGVLAEKIKEALNFKEIDGVHDLKTGKAKTVF